MTIDLHTMELPGIDAVIQHLSAEIERLLRRESSWWWRWRQPATVHRRLHLVAARAIMIATKEVIGGDKQLAAVLSSEVICALIDGRTK